MDPPRYSCIPHCKPRTSSWSKVRYQPGRVPLLRKDEHCCSASAWHARGFHFSDSAKRRSPSRAAVVVMIATVVVLLGAAALGICQSGYWEARAFRVEPGPSVVATRGEVWPKAQQQVYYDGYMVLRPSIFKFKVSGESCDMLQDALKRYRRTVTLNTAAVRTRHHKVEPKIWKRRANFKGYMDTLEVRLLSPCEEIPKLNMDERYELRINTPERPGTAQLTSNSIWGILRGLETFSQILTIDLDGVALIANSTEIVDFPRFSHRGLLLDTARHFLPIRSILRTLDAMEANKMNVFHWHIVDDQSFPYQSAAFPELSEKGAYHPSTHVYTRDDIREIIDYARHRGIRVVPEFDSPGHTRSWGQGVPNLLTACYVGDEPDGSLGPINPIQNFTYDFLNTFLQEVVELFPEKYVHLGGDEVSFDCWASNPDILTFMEAKNMTGQFSQLESFYIQRLVDTAKALNASSVVWQEVFDNKVVIPADTVVHIWTGDQRDELNKVTKAGHPTLLSACWYLDHLTSGGDWRNFYYCDPHDFSGSQEQKDLVIGGEACMWAEVVDESNLESRVWPRAAAAAEKLWSAYEVRDVGEAARRLEEHTCRLKRRGIHAQPPNGPGFCP